MYLLPLLYASYETIQAIVFDSTLRSDSYILRVNK